MGTPNFKLSMLNSQIDPTMHVNFLNTEKIMNSRIHSNFLLPGQLLAFESYLNTYSPFLKSVIQGSNTTHHLEDL